jgi:hypothetical protein
MTIDDIESVSGNTEAPKAAAQAVAEPEKEVGGAPASNETEEVSTDETTDDSGTSDEKTGDETDNADGDQDGKPKRKGGVQKKIDKLTRRLTDRERELEYWKNQAIAKATPQASPKVDPKDEPKASATRVEGEPNPDDFASVTDYFKALTKFEREQDRKVYEAKRAESDAQEAQKKKRDAHLARVDEFRKTTADFAEAIEDVGDFPLSPEFEDAIMDSELGPQLIYALAKDRAELERVSKLQGASLQRALGRIEAKIESQSSQDKPEPKKSAAPTPIKPLGQSSKSSAVKTPEDMDIEEYMAWRRKTR